MQKEFQLALNPKNALIIKDLDALTTLVNCGTQLAAKPEVYTESLC